MNFIKSMLGGKPRLVDQDAATEFDAEAVDDHVDWSRELGPEDPAAPEEAEVAGIDMTSLQSQLDLASVPEAHPDTVDQDENDNEQVSDFVDLLHRHAKATIDPSGSVHNDAKAPPRSDTAAEILRNFDEMDHEDAPGDDALFDGAAPTNAASNNVDEVLHLRGILSRFDDDTDAPAGTVEEKGVSADPDTHPTPQAADAPKSPEVEVEVEAVVPEPAPTGPKIVAVPAPTAGRAGRRAGRVKTRLLGFEHAHSDEPDVFAADQAATNQAEANFPVGWIVVVDGPGRGASFSLFNGVSQIGRGEDQQIKLAFGDNSISRSNHAAIAYDSEQRTFFLGHGGKANLVRLNDKPVLSTEEINNRDLIRLGETTLRFVGLCGADFDWDTPDEKDLNDAAIA